MIDIKEIVRITRDSRKEVKEAEDKDYKDWVASGSKELNDVEDIINCTAKNGGGYIVYWLPIITTNVRDVSDWIVRYLKNKGFHADRLPAEGLISHIRIGIAWNHEVALAK